MIILQFKKNTTSYKIKGESLEEITEKINLFLNKNIKAERLQLIEALKKNGFNTIKFII